MSPEPQTPEQPAASSVGGAAPFRAASSDPSSGPGSDPSSGPTPATTPSHSDGPDGSDELAILDQLEADLIAVEQAITTLDQISSDGVGGEQAAAEIVAAVSTGRFGHDASGDSATPDAAQSAPSTV